MLEDQET